jgi:hypothetical protein
MGFIGVQPASIPLTASDITNDIINADKIADNSISEEHLDPTIVTGLSALAETPADTDEFLFSDAGTLKRIDYSYIKGGGGLVRLGGASATGVNVGDVSFDVFSATYNMYVCYFRINFIADSSQSWLKLRSSGSYTTSSDYKFIFHGENWSETETAISTSGGDTKFRLTGGTGSSDNLTSSYGKVVFYMPYSSSHMTYISIDTHEQDESAILTARNGAGVYQSNSSLNGFGFMGSSQNLEQYDFQVFGVKQS